MRKTIFKVDGKVFYSEKAVVSYLRGTESNGLIKRTKNAYTDDITEEFRSKHRIVLKNPKKYRITGY